MTQADLNGLTCQVPGCTHDDHEEGLYFHGRCHPSSPTQVRYVDGKLTIECKACKSVVAVIAVAP